MLCPYGRRALCAAARIGLDLAVKITWAWIAALAVVCSPVPAAAAEPLPPSVSAMADEVVSGTLVAEGPGVRVERVVLAGPPGVVFRIRVFGRFALRGQPLIILVDGMPVGRAVEAPDLRSATVAIADDARIKDGSLVSYRYGNGPAVVVGELRRVG